MIKSLPFVYRIRQKTDGLQPWQLAAVLLEAVALVSVMGLAAYLRWTNVADNPGWYADEGTHLDIARHLLNGEVRYMAIDQSILLFARFPLFEWLLTGVSSINGLSMESLRLLTGTLGVISVGTFYAVLRMLQADRLLPLLAALMLAIYPQAVLYSRLGFSYNLLTPFMLVLLLALGMYWRSTTRHWLALAALAIGVGMLSDLMMGTMMAALGVVVVIRRPADLLWSVPLAGVPFVLYALWKLVTVPDAFLFDLNHILFRLNTMTLTEQIDSLLINYMRLLTRDLWMPLGLVGLFLIRPVHVRIPALLMLMLPVLILGRTVALFHLSAYYMIALLPLPALGVAYLIRYAVPHVLSSVQAAMPDAPAGLQRLIHPLVKISAGGIVLFLIAVPLLDSLSLTLHHVHSGFESGLEGYLVEADAARAVADYVNPKVGTDDLVIASPALSWMFDSNAADVQMSVAANGVATVHLPADVPAERFVFDPYYTNADFVVVDDVWRRWGVVHMPQAGTILDEVQTWPLVLESGSLQVYRNPQR